VKAYELSRKYALALFSEALEKWVSALNAVQNELANNPALLAGLEDSTRPFSQKQEALDKLIPAGTEKPVRNFLYTMLREDDIAQLSDVVEELERMMRGGPQVQVARVTTAMELSEADKEQFRQKLRDKYGENLELVFNVAPDILGGAVVQIGDKVIDGSVATRLQALSNTLGVRTVNR
jgi:F-type H+-transporting ATPase subunit delta